MIAVIPGWAVSVPLLIAVVGLWLYTLDRDRWEDE